MEVFKVSEKDRGGKYYKVVSEVNGSLGSAVMKDKAKVEYILGAWVSAPPWLACKEYHLFVYDKLIGAECLATNTGHYIYNCEVRGVYRKLPQCLESTSLSRGEFEVSAFEQFPLWTVMVREVKLLKEVK